MVGVTAVAQWLVSLRWLNGRSTDHISIKTDKCLYKNRSPGEDVFVMMTTL